MKTNLIECELGKIWLGSRPPAPQGKPPPPFSAAGYYKFLTPLWTANIGSRSHDDLIPDEWPCVRLLSDGRIPVSFGDRFPKIWIWAARRSSFVKVSQDRKVDSVPSHFLLTSVTAQYHVLSGESHPTAAWSALASYIFSR